MADEIELEILECLKGRNPQWTSTLEIGQITGIGKDKLPMTLRKLLGEGMIVKDPTGEKPRWRINRGSNTAPKGSAPVPEPPPGFAPLQTKATPSATGNAQPYWKQRPGHREREAYNSQSAWAGHSNSNWHWEKHADAYWPTSEYTPSSSSWQKYGHSKHSQHAEEPSSWQQTPKASTTLRGSSQNGRHQVRSKSPFVRQRSQSAHRRDLQRGGGKEARTRSAGPRRYSRADGSEHSNGAAPVWRKARLPPGLELISDTNGAGDKRLFAHKIRSPPGLDDPSDVVKEAADVDTSPTGDLATATTASTTADDQEDFPTVTLSHEDEANPKGRLLEMFGQKALSFEMVPEDPFKAKVLVANGKWTFTSSGGHQNKSAAHQAVAKKALLFFLDHPDDVPQEAVQDCKHLLTKVTDVAPRYTSCPSSLGGFDGTVIIGSVVVQAIIRGRGKRDAENFAAKAALEKFGYRVVPPAPDSKVQKTKAKARAGESKDVQGGSTASVSNGDADNEGSHPSKAKAHHRRTDEEDEEEDDIDGEMITPPNVADPADSPHIAEKDFKSDLNILMPRCKVDYFTEVLARGGFISIVKVDDLVFKSDTVGRKKVDAEKFAAKLAVEHLTAAKCEAAILNPRRRREHQEEDNVDEELQKEALEEQRIEHARLKKILKEQMHPEFQRVKGHLSACITEARRANLINDAEKIRLMVINTRGNCAKHCPERLKPKQETEKEVRAKEEARLKQAKEAGLTGYLSLASGSKGRSTSAHAARLGQALQVQEVECQRIATSDGGSNPCEDDSKAVGTKREQQLQPQHTFYALSDMDELHDSEFGSVAGSEGCGESKDVQEALPVSHLHALD